MTCQIIGASERDRRTLIKFIKKRYWTVNRMYTERKIRFGVKDSVLRWKREKSLFITRIWIYTNLYLYIKIRMTFYSRVCIYQLLKIRKISQSIIKIIIHRLLTLNLSRLVMIDKSKKKSRRITYIKRR